MGFMDIFLRKKEVLKEDTFAERPPKKINKEQYLKEIDNLKSLGFNIAESIKKLELLLDVPLHVIIQEIAIENTQGRYTFSDNSLIMMKENNKFIIVNEKKIEKEKEEIDVLGFKLQETEEKIEIIEQVKEEKEEVEITEDLFKELTPKKELVIEKEENEENKLINNNEEKTKKRSFNIKHSSKEEKNEEPVNEQKVEIEVTKKERKSHFKIKND